MAEHARRLHDEWLAADAAAKALEQQLKAHWDAYFSGNGEPPDEQLTSQANAARQASSDRLAALVDYMQSVSRGTKALG